MDQIRMENLEVYCHHGVLKEETVLGQKFLVSLILYTDTKKAGHSDDLSYSIDYAEISHFVEEKRKEKNYQLIEAAAEQLAGELLRKFRALEKICVEIKKPWAPILLPIDYVSVTIERKWTTVYLSVGSNMGNREEHIENAIEMLRDDFGIRKVKESVLIDNEPYGYTDQPNFLNGAVSLETIYSPWELLDVLHKIEKEGHRVRDIRWGPRTIDLDIVFYGEEIINDDDLVIPHRDMHRRRFVLEPLSELAPWAVHPVFHKTVYEMLQQLTEKERN